MKAQELAMFAASQVDHLTVQVVTYGSNGYPLNLGDYFVTGFESYKEAERFVEEYGGEINLARKKGGWDFVEIRGRKFECLTYNDYLEDLGENYEAFFEEQLDIAELMDRISEQPDFDAIKDLIDNLAEIKEEFDTCSDEQVVIVGHGKFHEIIDMEMMSYCVDGTTWYVGVFLPRNMED